MSGHANKHTLSRRVETMLGHLARNPGLEVHTHLNKVHATYVGEPRDGLPVRRASVGDAAVHGAWNLCLLVQTDCTHHYKPSHMGFIIGRLVNQRDTAYKRRDEEFERAVRSLK